MTEFYAVYLYAVNNVDNLFDVENYKQWTRLARNLIPRTISNQYEFASIIKTIKETFEIIRINQNYLEAIANFPIYNLQETEETVFHNIKSKLLEEKLKANLMLKNPEWKQKIEFNEKNKFLAGETYYLLKFSGITTDTYLDTISEENFNKYCRYTRINNLILSNVFQDKNTKVDDNKLVMRALFAMSEENLADAKISDKQKIELSKNRIGYLLELKNNHYSFATENMDRDYSFRNLFRVQNKDKVIYMKILMDKLIDLDTKTEIDLTENLKKIINETRVHNWKKYFIKNDKIFTMLKPNTNLLKIEINQKGGFDIFLLNGKQDGSLSLPLIFVAIYEKSREKNLKICSGKKELTKLMEKEFV